MTFELQGVTDVRSSTGDVEPRGASASSTVKTNSCALSAYDPQDQQSFRCLWCGCLTKAWSSWTQAPREQWDHLKHDSKSHHHHRAGRSDVVQSWPTGRRRVVLTGLDTHTSRLVSARRSMNRLACRCCSASQVLGADCSQPSYEGISMHRLSWCAVCFRKTTVRRVRRGLCCGIFQTPRRSSREEADVQDISGRVST